MREGGFDALVLAQPETLKWATGAFPGVDDRELYEFLDSHAGS